MTPEKIPEEIKKQIKNQMWHLYISANTQQVFKTGAEYGYGLIEAEVKNIWNAAIIFASNLCVQLSDEHNNDDHIVEADTANKCAKEIQKFIDHVHPDLLALHAHGNAPNFPSNEKDSVGEVVAWFLDDIAKQSIESTINKLTKINHDAYEANEYDSDNWRNSGRISAFKDVLKSLQPVPLSTLQAKQEELPPIVYVVTGVYNNLIYGIFTTQEAAIKYAGSGSLTICPYEVEGFVPSVLMDESGVWTDNEIIWAWESAYGGDSHSSGQEYLQHLKSQQPPRTISEVQAKQQEGSEIEMQILKVDNINGVMTIQTRSGEGFDVDKNTYTVKVFKKDYTPSSPKEGIK